MSHEHLNEDDLIRATIANKPHTDREECAACNLEERWLQDALAHFRDAVHHYARQTAAAASQRDPLVPHSRPSWVYRLAAAMLALAMLISIPDYRHHERTVQTLQAMRDQQDDQLLQAIDEQTSTTVPQALAPLAQVTSDQTANSQ
ncbi:MAG: hypothetical protein JOZ43_01890 [Acidobacteriales bacterium]|nr:hypothetical protein [Terriglobales bacterium]